MKTLLSILCLAALPAFAHDTWFEPAGAGGVMSLGTGLRYPQQAFPIGPEQLRESGCRQADGTPARLVPIRVAPAALLVLASPGAADCWAQLQPFDVELSPQIVEVYLREIAAAASVRERWARLQAQGRPWKERFTKHARIALAGAPMRASPMGMDALIEGDAAPVAGQTLRVRVLRDGLPLAGQAMELVGSLGQSGGWFTTDGQGLVSFEAPAAGRWLLRGVDLRPSDAEPDAWDSRFLTLAFRTAAP